jgi:TfoX/Sxy family transcriptional regulator of competence genes
MAYNEKMADRVRELIAVTEKNVEEKRMFSGLCFMVNDKMCVAVRPDSIMVRFDPGMTEEVMEKEGTLPMVRSGTVMKGFVFVNESVLGSKKQLSYWVGMALDYNKFAKSSKTKQTAKGKGPVKKKAAAAKGKTPAVGKKVSAVVKGKKAVSSRIQDL